MRALAAIALLRDKGDNVAGKALRPDARGLLAKRVDAYYQQHPNTPMALQGQSIMKIESARAQLLTSLKELKDRQQAAIVEAEEATRQRQAEQEAMRQRVIAEDAMRVIAGQAAVALQAKEDEVKYDDIAQVYSDMAQATKEARATTGLHAPGWRVQAWPAVPVATTSEQWDAWLPRPLQDAVRLVYFDITSCALEELPTTLQNVSDHALALLQPRTNFTLCLYGTSSQTVPVMKTMTSLEWTWAPPYAMLMHSATHTLPADLTGTRDVHKICRDARTAGDTTFGLHQGIIFRLLRGSETDSTIRHGTHVNGSDAKGPGVELWDGGRSDFVKHQDGDVPYIDNFQHVSREPYHYSVDMSTVLPHATTYPVNFAITNFLYWHSRKGDVVLVLGDGDDIFGSTALYCGRRVVVALVQSLSPVDPAPCLKAYKTMALLMSEGGAAYFLGYTRAVKFATISRLLRNTRESLVDAAGILHSQETSVTKRWKRTTAQCALADLTTPCRMVHTHKHHYRLYTFL